MCQFSRMWWERGLLEQEEVVGMVEAYNLTVSFTSESSMESEFDRRSQWNLVLIPVHPWHSCEFDSCRKISLYLTSANYTNLISSPCSHWAYLDVCYVLLQVSYAVIFLYVAFMLGDHATTGAPFYVTSKVSGNVIFLTVEMSQGRDLI